MFLGFILLRVYQRMLRTLTAACGYFCAEICLFVSSAGLQAALGWGFNHMARVAARCNESCVDSYARAPMRSVGCRVSPPREAYGAQAVGFSFAICKADVCSISLRDSEPGRLGSETWKAGDGARSALANVPQRSASVV